MYYLRGWGSFCKFVGLDGVSATKNFSFVLWAVLSSNPFNFVTYFLDSLFLP